MLIFINRFLVQKQSANAAAIKAFLVNRVGDLGLILGICLIYFKFNSLDYNTVFESVTLIKDNSFSLLNIEIPIIELCCFLLFIGAMGKSAQIILHTWLADAMEGPTPVSALIHAATMVTAGVFLVARCSPIFEYAPYALGFCYYCWRSYFYFCCLCSNNSKRYKKNNCIFNM